jgi:glycosyltransferase involved in cell wall biosynthesis
MLSLTIVIPVFNEEHHIKACLDAIAAQTVAPDEVIIVDNNCTDRTLEIAEDYDFVRVIKESRQGRGYARTAGFNAAESDIIGRIDADSRIVPDWVENVKELFASDDELDGITGLAKASIIPYNNTIKSTIMARTYYWFAHAGFDTITTWGANMAVRKKAWYRVADKVILDDSLVHEDQDVALWMAAEGAIIRQENRVRITIDGQSYRYLPKLFHYFQLFRFTKRIHIDNGNLHNPKTPKLGFFRTTPGRVLALAPSLYMITVSVVLFPVDYLIHRKNPKSKWLE